MPTLVAEAGTITVPAWVTTLGAFVQWRESEEVPEEARICFFNGEPWVDLSIEEIYTHTNLKGEITTVLRTHVKHSQRGHVFPDGMLILNDEAELASEPDCTFVSNEAFAEGRIVEREGKGGGDTALVGTPDMVLEVVSEGSVKKDRIILLEKYYLAGIPEYWLVDARGSDVEFIIYKRGAKKYVRTREHDSWVKSVAFGAAFRLVRGTDARGRPEFTLEVR